MPDSSPPASPPRIAILVPCYNESATVQQVVGDFRAAIPEATVYAFDNNSTDGTADRVRDLLAPVLVDRADMVVGAREAEDQAAAYRRFHVFGNWLVRTLINVIFNARLKDIMSGYRAFTRDVALNLPVLAYGFDIETEMTLQCLHRRRVIREIPVVYRERPPGSVSKLSTFPDGFKVLFRILNVFRSYKPLTFFGGIGIALFMVSGLLATLGFADSGAEHPGRRTTLIVLGATRLAMSLVSASIGVIVQLINFRFLEADSIRRRRIR